MGWILEDRSLFSRLLAGTRDCAPSILAVKAPLFVVGYDDPYPWSSVRDIAGRCG